MSELTIILLLTVVLPIVLVFSIPTFAIWTHHRRKMQELSMKERANIDQAIHTEIEGLRAEIRSLRDTSMQYDLSFDTALQRLEQRIANVECRPLTVPSPSPQQENVRLGG